MRLGPALGVGVLAAVSAVAELSAVEHPRPLTMALWGSVAVLSLGIALVEGLRAVRDQRQAERDTQAAREARASEALRWHFETRGRGVDVRARPGWYFTGRTRALRELVGWLSGPDDDVRPRVVTGRPGSGKSAVLGRLVTLADPTRRTQVPVDAAAEGTLPPPGCIAVAVRATGLTLEQIVSAIGDGLGIEAGAEQALIDALVDRSAPPVIVVDAVDEAARPQELARKLLRPLAASGGVRLLAGTRPHLVSLLGVAAVVLDLDDPAYLERADLTEYARRCLQLDGDPAARTPYRRRPDVAAAVAQAVAERAHPSFLVAQLASRSLAAADDIVDLDRPGWRERFPATVGEAMDDYLARFATDGQPDQEQRVRDLLLPLAYAEGLGLPDDDLWAALATVTGTRRYAPEDVRWLRTTAAVDLILQVESEGVSCARLFHEALAEHLRSDRPEREDQRRYTRALLGLVPEADRPGKDWLHAHPYLCSTSPPTPRVLRCWRICWSTQGSSSRLN